MHIKSLILASTVALALAGAAPTIATEYCLTKTIFGEPLATPMCGNAVALDAGTPGGPLVADVIAGNPAVPGTTTINYLGTDYLVTFGQAGDVKSIYRKGA